MRRLSFLISILSVILGPALSLAATFYVDNARPDNSGDGKSWATAKRTIASGYALLPPGDTLYISGGAAGKTYNIEAASVLLLNTPNTTISRGLDSGHNGTVIIDWQGKLVPGNSAIRVTGNKVKVTGVARGGLEIRNGEEVAISVEGHQAKIQYCNIHDWENESVDGRGINIQTGVSSYEISHTTIHNIGGYGIYTRGNNGSIHHSEIYNIGNEASFSFANGIELIGSDDNIIYSNRVYNCYNKVLTDGNSLELFKGSDNNRIYDNEFYNSFELIEVGDDEKGGIAPQGNLFFGNKLSGGSITTAGVAYYLDGNASPPTKADTWYNNVFYNLNQGFNINYSISLLSNTFYNCDTFLQLWGGLSKTITLKNNIFSVASKNGIVNWSSNTTLLHSNNAWWRAGNAYVYQDNSLNVRPTSLTTQFESTGYSGEIRFSDPAKADFRLTDSNDPKVLRGGAILTSPYDTDFALLKRSGGSGYSMGAYQFTVAPVLKPAPPRNLKIQP